MHTSRRVACLCAALLAGAPTLAAATPTEARVEAYSLAVERGAGPDDPTRLQVGLRVTVPTGADVPYRLAGLGEGSRVQRFTDDTGQDLLAAGDGTLMLPWVQSSAEHGWAEVPFAVSARPGLQASQLVLAGKLELRLASTSAERRVRLQGVNLDPERWTDLTVEGAQISCTQDGEDRHEGGVLREFYCYGPGSLLNRVEWVGAPALPAPRSPRANLQVIGDGQGLTLASGFPEMQSAALPFELAFGPGLTPAVATDETAVLLSRIEPAFLFDMIAPGFCSMPPDGMTDAELRALVDTAGEDINARGRIGGAVRGELVGSGAARVDDQGLVAVLNLLVLPEDGPILGVCIALLPLGETRVTEGEVPLIAPTVAWLQGPLPGGPAYLPVVQLGERAEGLLAAPRTLIEGDGRLQLARDAQGRVSGSLQLQARTAPGDAAV
jgi:hypothetical protein